MPCAPQERIFWGLGHIDMPDIASVLPDCTGVGDVLSRIGDKWSIQIIVALHLSPKRFNSIKRTVPGISQQMLTRTLKALERDGFVERAVYHTTPPQVEYALTNLGISLSDPVRQLAAWAIDHRMEIGQAREHFDEAK